MINLTPNEARRLIDKLHHNQTKEHGISILEEKYLAALEIALTVLEQQERGCKSCGGNGHVEIDHGELGIEHMTCDKCTVTSEQQERVEGEWIEWGGGDCPVEADCDVEVKFRDGDIIKGEAAIFWEWPHHLNGGDIIAYRVIENDGREG